MSQVPRIVGAEWPSAADGGRPTRPVLPQLHRRAAGSPSRATRVLGRHNPARGEVIARTPLSTGAGRRRRRRRRAEGVSRRGATRRRSRAPGRSSGSRQLLEEHFEELARIVTTEHGKTLDESRGSVRRGIECVEVACGTPSLMMGYGLENISHGIDCQVHPPAASASSRRSRRSTSRRWCRSGSCPFAIATGNTFVLKPSEQVPLSQKRMFELLERVRPAARRREPRQRRPRGRRGDLRPPGHRGRLVRRLDARRARRLPARDARRQARPGARRREELHRRDAGRRLRPRDRRSSPSPSTAAPASAASPGASLVPVGDAHGDGARPARRAARGAQGRRRHRAGRRRWARSSAAGTASRSSATSRRASPRARSSLLDGRGAHGRRAARTATSSARRSSTTSRPTMTIGREEIFGPVASITPGQDSRRGDRGHARAPERERDVDLHVERQGRARVRAPRVRPRWSASTSASRRRWRTSRSAARRTASSAT